MDTPLVLMDSRRIARSVKRMGYEIVEQNTANLPLLLFGINERGFAVAQQLKNVLTEISSIKIDIIRLPIGSDTETKSLPDYELKGKLGIVVDDVIFSGQTMFRALRKIADRLKPAELHTAVMIDRGHRKFPIEAEFCGMKLPTKLNEHVSVEVKNRQVKQVVLQKEPI